MRGLRSPAAGARAAQADPGRAQAEPRQPDLRAEREAPAAAAAQPARDVARAGAHLAGRRLRELLLQAGGLQAAWALHPGEHVRVADEEVLRAQALGEEAAELEQADAAQLGAVRRHDLHVDRDLAVQAGRHPDRPGEQAVEVVPGAAL